MSDSQWLAVVDDDDAVRDSMASVLSANGYRVDSFGSGEDFLSGQNEQFSCLLLDIQMPGISGIEVLRTLAARNSSLPTIMLTGHGTIPLAVKAMKMGASDFIEKPFNPHALLESILALHDKGRSQVARSECGIGQLAPREVDVLRGLMKGHPNKLIAYDLDLSVRTVEHYRARLMAKLEVKSLPELVRIGIENGL